MRQAQTRLSELLARVERGERIMIARAGSPVAQLVPIDAFAPRTFGVLDILLTDDVDDPLPDDELDRWDAGSGACDVTVPGV